MNSLINEVLPNLYLSGINVFDIENIPLLESYGIRHILCCLSYNQATPSHQIYLNNRSNQDSIDILYIPYIDYLNQHLWEINNSAVIYSVFNNTNLLNNYDQVPYMQIAYDFINNALSHNEKILVHCFAGISRSTSVIIYYIMKHYSVDYDTAYKIVLDARPIIQPNASFVQQLKYYDLNRDLIPPLMPVTNVYESFGYNIPIPIPSLTPTVQIAPMQRGPGWIPDTYDMQKVITINGQLPPFPY
jgi:dual specificity phosphatase 12